MIRLVDTTVRDGHQSLWSADALTTAMIAEIAPVMDFLALTAWLVLTGALVALIWVAFAPSVYAPFLDSIVGGAYLIIGGILALLYSSMQDKSLDPSVPFRY